MRYEPAQTLIEVCSRWHAAFPDRWRDPVPSGGTDRDRLLRLGHRLNSYQWPVAQIPNLRPEEWAQVADTGVRDTLDHATQILGEYEFEPVAEQEFDTGLYGLRLVRLFVHDGVIAQIEGCQRDGAWCVDDFTIWGIAEIRDDALFDTLTLASHAGLRCDRERPPGERRRRLNISTFAGSLGIGWLAATTAVDWVTPWPEPAIVTWLGPREPSPRLGPPDLDEASRVGQHNTAALLAKIPNHVHDRFGTIATRS